MKAGEAGASPSRRGPSASARGSGGRGVVTRPGAGVSPGPRGSPGPGRTPQTKRKELSLTLTTTEKASPSGSPRSRAEEGRGAAGRKAEPVRSRRKGDEPKEPESSRKSSNSSQDSGVGREAVIPRNRPVTKRTNQPQPAIRTVSPDSGESEVGERKKFGELSDLTSVELGMVKVPPELLQDLIHKEPIERYYTIDEVPVARSGLFLCFLLYFLYSSVSVSVSVPL